MNTYAQNMKTVIQTFAAEMKSIDTEIKESTAKYLPDIAAEHNAKTQARADELYSAAQADIEALTAAAVADVDKWGTISGDNIHPDIKLFDGGFTLTADELGGLVMKHKGNGTMTRAISDYASKNNITLDNVPTAFSKKEAWAKLSASALSLLADIYKSPAGGAMLDCAVENWGNINACTSDGVKSILED